MYVAAARYETAKRKGDYDEESSKRENAKVCEGWVSP
jgi:hypothetical protein